MTNVPDDVRAMWKDVYVLFDKHYLMDVSKQESWEKFWDEARQIYEKYPQIESLIDLLSCVSELLVKEAARRKANGRP